ncbi:MAG: hypothetical protein DMF63_14325 [Acidobacteria bacterium]|nr:MAG: hypothetical protein DMF63_14325 [Acidobacteriota bacterium]
MKLDGRWEGKLLDVSGPEALLTLDLAVTDNKIRGDFSVAFIPPSGENGCCGDVPRLAQIGAVNGRIDAKTGRIQLSYEVSTNLTSASVTFDGVLKDADPHARQAFVGTYGVGKGGESLSLEGGSCVLWQFAQSAPKSATKSKGKGVKHG